MGIGRQGFPGQGQGRPGHCTRGSASHLRPSASCPEDFIGPRFPETWDFSTEHQKKPHTDGLYACSSVFIPGPARAQNPFTKGVIWWPLVTAWEELFLGGEMRTARGQCPTTSIVPRIPAENAAERTVSSKCGTSRTTPPEGRFFSDAPYHRVINRCASGDGCFL